MAKINNGIRKYGSTDVAKISVPVKLKIFCNASRALFGKNSSTALKKNEKKSYQNPEHMEFFADEFSFILVKIKNQVVR